MTTTFLIGDFIRDEGKSLKSYQDSRGNWTNGIGHKLIPNAPVPDITDEQAIEQLNLDIFEKELELDRAIPWWRELSDLRQDVFVNIGFNVGVNEFSTWKNTLGYAKSGDYIGCAEELRRTEPWHSQVGKRADRLADQMETNVHQS